MMKIIQLDTLCIGFLLYVLLLFTIELNLNNNVNSVELFVHSYNGLYDNNSTGSHSDIRYDTRTLHKRWVLKFIKVFNCNIYPSQNEVGNLDPSNLVLCEQNYDHRKSYHMDLFQRNTIKEKLCSLIFVTINCYLQGQLCGLCLSFWPKRKMRMILRIKMTLQKWRKCHHDVADSVVLCASV